MAVRGTIGSRVTAARIRTALVAVAVLAYLGGTAPLVAILAMALQQPSSEADAHLVAHSGPAIAILFLVALPFTMSVGAAVTAFVASIDGTGSRWTVPPTGFTARERRYLASSGAVICFGVGFLVVTFATYHAVSGSPSTAADRLVVGFAVSALSVAAGYLLMAATLLVGTPPTRGWERLLGGCFALVIVFGVVTGILGGIALFAAIAVVLPVAVLAVGYTRDGSAGDPVSHRDA